MAGYTRQSIMQNGNPMDADLFNDEYNALVGAFDEDDGHRHDGSTSEGSLIPLISNLTGDTQVEVSELGGFITFSVEVSDTKEEQANLEDGVLYPSTDADFDLGRSSNQFKDLYLSGEVVASSVNLSGSTVNQVLDEDDLSSNDDSSLATQQSIKAYVDDTASGLQPLSSDLTTLSGLSKTDNNFIVADGTDWTSISGEQALAATGVTASVQELNYSTGLSSNIQDQLNTLSSDKLDNSGLTAERILLTDVNGDVNTSTVTTTEFGNLSGINSNIQNQIDSKLENSGFTASRVIRSDLNGDLGTSSITTTELDSLSGISSNIQNQLDDKAETNGDYTSLRARSTTQGDVGLSNLRNVIQYSQSEIDSSLSGKANTSGNYTNLRAQATTQSDVGLPNVRNVEQYSQSESDNRYLRSDASNYSITFDNNEADSSTLDDGEVIHDSSAGLYVLSSNASHANPALMWTSANFTASSNLSVSYDGEDHPTLSVTSTLNNMNNINMSGDINGNGSTNFYMGNRARLHSSSSYTYLTLNNTSQFRIRNGSTPVFQFNQGGTFHANGDVVAYSNNTGSDVLYKDNIEKPEDPCWVMDNLDGYEFFNNKVRRSSAGLIAQMVEKVVPRLVLRMKDIGTNRSRLHLDYNGLWAYLIEARKKDKEELNNTINEQEKRIKELESTVEELRNASE